jgi:hypothetical protein
MVCLALAACTTQRDATQSAALAPAVGHITVNLCDPDTRKGPSSADAGDPGADSCWGRIALSPDGRRIALQTVGRVDMIDAATGHVMWTHRARGQSMIGRTSAFSSDGRIFAVTEEKGRAFLDVETGAVTAKTECLWKVSPDGLLSDEDGVVHCIAMPAAVVMPLAPDALPFEEAVSRRTGEVIPTVGPRGARGVASFKPPRPVGPLAIAPRAPGGPAALWGVQGEDHVAYYGQAGKAWERDEPVAGSAQLLGFTGDEKRLVFQSVDGQFEVLVVDAATGKDVERLPGRICEDWRRAETAIVCVGRTPSSGSQIGDEQYVVFSAPTSSQPFVLPVDAGWSAYDHLYEAAFLRGGAYFAYIQEKLDEEPSGGWKAALRVVRVADGALVYERALDPEPSAENAQRTISIAENGSRAATFTTVDGDARGDIEVWDLPTL